MDYEGIGSGEGNADAVQFVKNTVAGHTQLKPVLIKELIVFVAVDAPATPHHQQEKYDDYLDSIRVMGEGSDCNSSSLSISIARERDLTTLWIIVVSYSLDQKWWPILKEREQDKLKFFFLECILKWLHDFPPNIVSQQT